MEEQWAAIIIVGITLSLGVPGIVACVWLWAWRGRAGGGREDAYRKLVEDLSDSQRRTAFELGQIAEDLGDVRVRVVELERMLKEIE